MPLSSAAWALRGSDAPCSLHPCLRSQWPSPAYTQEGTPGGGALGTILRAACHSHPCFFLLYVRNLSKKPPSIFIF